MSSKHPMWKETALPDGAWRPPHGWSREQRIAEQDEAAGGAREREIVLHDGRRVHASIAFRRQPKGRRVYAYLRWSVAGKTHERYVGEVDQVTRAANLQQAWRLARNDELLVQAVQPQVTDDGDIVGE